VSDEVALKLIDTLNGIGHALSLICIVLWLILLFKDMGIGSMATRISNGLRDISTKLEKTK